MDRQREREREKKGEWKTDLHRKKEREGTCERERAAEKDREGLGGSWDEIEAARWEGKADARG